MKRRTESETNILVDRQRRRCIRHRLAPSRTDDSDDARPLFAAAAADDHRNDGNFTNDDAQSYRRQPVDIQQKLGDMVRWFRADADAEQRRLLLSALLSECCVQQLSYLSQTVPRLSRIDFLSTLPAELSLRVLSLLDARSLCRAARVCRSWRTLADCDVIWHRLCEQHIEKKCAKCGWNLPLMPIVQPQPRSRCDSSSSSAAASSSAASTPAENAEDDTNSIPKMHWKTLYAERMLCEKNWRQNRFRKSTLAGHTAAVLCSQMLQRRLATGSRDRTVRVWNLDTSQCELVLRGHDDDVTALQFDKVRLQESG